MVLEGILSVLTPTCLFWSFVGTVIGIIFGSIPGLTAVMAMVLFLPMSFGMPTAEGIALLLGLYVGGISGGCISAVLLKIPGTPASLCTVFDGGPMADRGEAGRAIGISVLYSFIGGILSAASLIFIAPYLAKVALKFSPFEYCAVIFMSLTIIASLAGKSMINGLISGAAGLFVSCIGVSPIGGVLRCTMGSKYMMSGISTTVMLIGIFAIAEIIKSAADPTAKGEKANYKMKGFGITWKEFCGQTFNMLRSAVIGICIGILPGLGANTSSMLAYGIAQSNSKYPEKFGTGIIDGMVASETANNANTGGAMIPALTLGIPGNTPTALLIAALTVKGVTPGPLIFEKNGVLAYGVFASFVIANIMMLILEWRGIKLFVKVLDMPKYIMYPAIIVLCMVGAFSDKSRSFDVLMAVAFGIAVYFLKKFGFATAPFVLGNILGGLFETYYGRAMSAGDGSYLPFFTRPVACAFMILAVVCVVFVIKKNVRHEKNILADDDEEDDTSAAEGAKA